LIDPDEFRRHELRRQVLSAVRIPLGLIHRVVATIADMRWRAFLLKIVACFKL
jgi:hypothetical protein